MDPNATWRDIQSALMAYDWDKAIELAEALLSWMERGGFPPVICNKEMPPGWHRTMAEAGARYVITAAGCERAEEQAEREEEAEREQGTQP